MLTVEIKRKRKKPKNRSRINENPSSTAEALCLISITMIRNTIRSVNMMIPRILLYEGRNVCSNIYTDKKMNAPPN